MALDHDERSLDLERTLSPNSDRMWRSAFEKRDVDSRSSLGRPADETQRQGPSCARSRLRLSRLSQVTIGRRETPSSGYAKHYASAVAAPL